MVFGGLSEKLFKNLVDLATGRRYWKNHRGDIWKVKKGAQCGIVLGGTEVSSCSAHYLHFSVT